MRRILLLVALLMGASGLSYGQTQIAIEDFEDGTVIYTTSVPEFTDGSFDFFQRSISPSLSVSNIQGSGIFEAMDIDGEGASLPVFLNIENIDISGYTSIEIRVYLAEEDDGSNQDWDSGDYVHINADVDNGATQNLIWIENDGSTFNSAPFLDTNFDGTGDGTEITSTFVQFSANITGTGDSLDIQIEFQLDSGDEDIAIDNIEILGTSSSSIPSLSLTGSAGFRMLSTPVAVTYSSFLDPIWTQGATSADATTGNPNVFTWNTSTGAYSGVTDLSGTITAGSGFMVYVFADDDFNGSADAFPKTLSVSGTENAEGTSVNVNTTGDGYTLVGNPFASTIDFDNVTKTDLTNTAYVWDNTSSDWKDWNSDSQTGDLTDGLITTYQGFFVQTATTPAGTPSVAFPSGAKSSGGSFYGKKVADKPEAIRFELNGEELSNASWITFNEFGSINQVMADAVELESLNNDYAKLAIVKDDVLINTANLPIQTVDSYSLPVEISATKAGTYTISATNFNLSEDKTLTFYDYETGYSAVIDENFSYSFELDAPAQKRTATALPTAPVEAKASGASRFGVGINPGVINSNEEVATPQAFSLEQNYPNPFNPSTTIEYSVDKAGAVNLSVYNLMGQKVAELVNEAKSAGSYKVQWNAAGAASGMYYYRLDANGVSITRKMTLIK